MIEIEKPRIETIEVSEDANSVNSLLNHLNVAMVLH